MRSRINLHEILVEKMGSRQVYFNPPETIKMKYPCIVYHIDTINTRRADDKLYNGLKRYQIIVIDKDPDSDIPDSIIELPYCSLDRTYKAEGLCHFVFTLYY